MTHNDFDFYEDLIRPLMKFLVQANILQGLGDSDEDEDSVEDEEGLDDHARSEIVKVRRQKSLQFDLTSTKGFDCLDQLSITQRLQAEANQVRFTEEFFIPPRMKQTYIQKATDTYFN